MLMGKIFHNFADAEPCAQAELDRAGQTSLFDRYEWFNRTQAECPLPGKPLIVRAQDDSFDAWLFLTESGHGRAEGLSSWYTLAFRPVFKGVECSEAKATLVMEIAQRLSPRLNTIQLSPMRQTDCDVTASGFRQAGWAAIAQETCCNWTTEVAGRSFDEYWAARPSRLRKTVKTKRARANMEIQIFTRFDEAAWADYESIYTESWKPAEGAANFLRAMAESEGSAGALLLGIGRIGGQAVAAQLWTCENGTAIAHKVAHRDSAAEHSPGSILSAAMFEHLIDVDRVSLIDFGTGDSRYKSSWMEQRAPLYTLSLFNLRSAAGIFGASRLGVGRLLRAVRGPGSE
jgi:Acetyltransferase (GNAT) domain